MAKGLHEFGFLARAVNPQWTPDTIKTTVEKEAREVAEELVNSGGRDGRRSLIWRKCARQFVSGGQKRALRERRK